jgi:peptidyl-prolyl cis-trans isomerase A (cyclophilin A)
MWWWSVLACPKAVPPPVPVPPPAPVDALIPLIPPEPPASLDPALANLDPMLLDASLAPADPAPAEFTVRFATTEGTFDLRVHRDWAPNAADRLYDLVQARYYDEQVFYRVVEGFVVQWGLSPYPAVNAVWREQRMPDDPVVETNTAGRMSFASAGPNSRTVQVFVNLVDNQKLDEMGFAPVGEVVEGFDVVQHLYSGYGEGAPRGRGPGQGRIGTEGKAYTDTFPELDRILSAVVVP